MFASLLLGKRKKERIKHLLTEESSCSSFHSESFAVVMISAGPLPRAGLQTGQFSSRTLTVEPCRVQLDVFSFKCRGSSLRKAKLGWQHMPLLTVHACALFSFSGASTDVLDTPIPSCTLTFQLCTLNKPDGSSILQPGGQRRSWFPKRI